MEAATTAIGGSTFFSSREVNENVLKVLIGLPCEGVGTEGES